MDALRIAARAATSARGAPNPEAQPFVLAVIAVVIVASACVFCVVCLRAPAHSSFSLVLTPSTRHYVRCAVMRAHGAEPVVVVAVFVASPARVCV